MKSSHKTLDVTAPRTPEVLRCLGDQPQWIHLLKGQNKPYEPILESLEYHLTRINLGIEGYDYTVSGTIKSLSISIIRLKKWVNMIYSDLFELNFNEPDLFKTDGTMYDLSFQGLHKVASMRLWLDAQLNIGEIFFCGFLNAKVTGSLFYITSISHEYEKGELRNIVFLDVKEPNIYRNFISDKARFYKYLGAIDQFGLDESKRDDFLRKLYPH